jgi:hypothetical protein
VLLTHKFSMQFFFLVDHCWSIFLMRFVLYVFHKYAACDYPFDVFKLFLSYLYYFTIFYYIKAVFINCIIHVKKQVEVFYCSTIYGRPLHGLFISLLNKHYLPLFMNLICYNFVETNPCQEIYRFFHLFFNNTMLQDIEFC